ncbi:hypothetical protein [Streptomyces sp. BH055]|uniref:hypothetical protein n=1 Tax=Streptomyces sp. BH055 TaxID=3401173 RepID=UPI003BB592DF
MGLDRQNATGLIKARNGTVSSPQKADTARQAGADHIVLSTGAALVEPVLELTGGEGTHVVFDGGGEATRGPRAEDAQEEVRQDPGGDAEFGAAQRTGRVAWDMGRAASAIGRRIAKPGYMSSHFTASIADISGGQTGAGQPDMFTCRRRILELLAGFL